MTKPDFKKSVEMFERAQKLTPTGYQAPQNPYFYGLGNSPAFLKGAKGCRITDVDGNEYVDYLCGLGAMVLGYRHPKVEEAARKQADQGDLMTFPSERWLDLAEFMVERIPGMEWANFGKNGSDATSYMVQVARTHTGKNGIAMISHAYHGIHHWCCGPTPGVPEEYRKHVYEFAFNDTEGLEKIVSEHSGDMAAVILTPVRHDVADDQELPAEGFFKKVREICDREGMLLLLDDIRCGFRYHPDGSAAYFGMDADMIAFGKAVSNGQPISIAMGKEKLMDAARQFMWIGTHFYSAVPMAAAIACLTELKESGAVEHMTAMGEMLREGVTGAAEEAGLPVRYSGHPTMPLLLFEEDPAFERAKKLSALMIEKGFLIHPIHNWFISAAHKEEDISRTVDAFSESFQEIANEG